MNLLNQLDLDTIVLSIATAVALMLMLKWHLDDKNNFDVRTSLMKDGHLSLAKMGQLVALLVSTWIIIYQTRKGLLTDWLFTGYMIAWSGANLASKYIDSKSGRSTYEQTTTQSYGNEPIERQYNSPMEPREYTSNVSISTPQSGIKDFRSFRRN